MKVIFLLVILVSSCQYKTEPPVNEKNMVFNKKIIKNKYEVVDTSESSFKRIISLNEFGDTVNVYILSGFIQINIKYNNNKPLQVAIDNRRSKDGFFLNHRPEFAGVDIRYDSLSRLTQLGVSYLKNEEISIVRFDSNCLPYQMYIQKDLKEHKTIQIDK